MSAIMNLINTATGKVPTKAPGVKDVKPKYIPNPPLPPVTLQLGDYTFTRLEIPEKIGLGGEQKLTIHELVGGDRVVDAMGAQFDPITWSGMFLGENALQSAKYIDYLRRQGKPLILKWSEMEYSVVINKFKYDFMQMYNIPYSITCEVVTDSSVQVTEGFDIDIDQALKDDMGSAAAASEALTADSITDVTKVKSSMDKLKATFNEVKSFVKATTTTIKEVKAEISAVQQEVTQAIATVNNTLQTVTTLGGILPSNPLSKNAAKLGNTAKTVNNATQLMNLKYTLGNMDKTIGTIKGTK